MKAGRLQLFLATCAALALPAAPALADVKAGVDAWSAGDFARAVAEWQGPAAAGDPDAMFNLAQAYRLGRGLERDEASALQLYRAASDKGHIQAADVLGLMLFQGGQKFEALPYIRAAADRGDPRSQYLLGLAHFNGDVVEKDWVRGYALVSLAHAAGLPQAAGAIAQMDQFIPMEERQLAAGLARQIEASAEDLRAAQMAAADLGSGQTVAEPSAVESIGTAMASAGRATEQTPARAPVQLASAPAPAAPASSRSTPSGGPWKVQLGAFSVRENAERLWSRLAARSELAGRERLLVPAGRVTKLQAGGFASQAQAQDACNRLKSTGQDCLVTRN